MDRFGWKIISALEGLIGFKCKQIVDGFCECIVFAELNVINKCNVNTIDQDK